MMLMFGDPEIWGFIPTFLDEKDPRSAREQINEKYMGGWNPFKGFTFDHKTATLSYPDDPPMKALSLLHFRDELLIIFDHAWVMVVQPDKSWEVARLD